MDPNNTTIEDERVVTPQQQPEEEIIERTLRPKRLCDFVGQHHIKEPLSISIEAASKRSEPIEHVLMYGNPGLGKTTLASIIAKEMGSNIRVTAGPALSRVGDLAAILSNLSKGDVLFIDEIHRINTAIEEVLYTAMEDFAIDIIVGKGPAAKTLRMPVEPFTLIGATTKLNLLSSPLRDRFGHIYHLTFYNENDIQDIVERNAALLEIDIHPQAAAMMSTRARKTPRVANRLLRRVRDYAQVRGNGIIDSDTTHQALDMLRVDPHGLDEIDRKILQTIHEKFSGGPVGLSTLAAAVAEEMETIETIYEPYLLQLGMIERTPRGRCITDFGEQHITS